jgi:cytochrome oxidase Cu insertion factor (SCO1/SenC/PrrC family)
MIAALSLSVALLLAQPARAHEAHLHSEPAQPPDEAGAVLFEPPEPGSYALPPIFRVPEQRLLDASGRPTPVLGLAEGEVALVSFIYTHCTQADGCPLALATLQRLDRALAGRAGVRLVTVSFDPERDTPEKMGRLRQALAPRGDWRFLTAPSPQAVLPVLQSYGQHVARAVDDPAVLIHVLKVFLVDAQRDVRNIYSTGFLDPRLILADIETLRRDRR